VGEVQAEPGNRNGRNGKKDEAVRQEGVAVRRLAQDDTIIIN
jgi:hypothetical protein